MVRLTNNVFRAISFGVSVWTPSTSAPFYQERNHRLSRNLYLQPVRYNRRSSCDRRKSPPDSRVTGADSPVMADSSTDAIPSTTSPSLGISSLTSQSPIALFKIAGGISRPEPSGKTRWATVSFFVFFSVSAWACTKPLSNRLRKVGKQYGYEKYQRHNNIIGS